MTKVTEDSQPPVEIPADNMLQMQLSKRKILQNYIRQWERVGIHQVEQLRRDETVIPLS
jgi:hypothetical protein